MHSVPDGTASVLSIVSLLTLFACGGDPSSPPLFASPSDFAFGDVYVGGSTSRSITLTNESTKPLTITDVSSTGSAVVTTGQALPLTLPPGESTSLAVELVPAATGDVAGTLTVTSDDPVSHAVVKHVGKGVHPASLVTASPAAIAWGEVVVGERAVQDVTLTNVSTREVRITSLDVTSSGLSASVPALPFTLRDGESASVAVAFAPTAAGAVKGNVAVRSDQPHPESIIELSGSGVVPATPVSVTASPTTLTFGDVTVGSFNARTVTLTNLSAEPVAISALDTTGAGFSASGLSLPATLSPGGSAALTVKFTSTQASASSGSLSVRSPSSADALAAVSYSANAVPFASITSVAVRDATTAASGSVQMAADVAATGTIDKSVTWSVDGGSAGSIDPTTGLYTAPATPGSYRVWATSKADSSKTGYGTVTVSAPQPVSISMSPTTASLTGGATQAFTSKVTGTKNAAVTWSVQEGAAGGSITAAGVYTAPANAGTYLVVVTSRADKSKRATATVSVTAPPQTPPSGVGTGTSYKPSNITNVTGGGSMPSWTTNVVTASCAGDGTTDDTACLQAAADKARSQDKPLAIPYTPAFYKISGAITIYTSVGGVGGMPTIKQTSTAGNATGNVLRLAAGMGGWVYNLRLVGAFSGKAKGEWAHNIDVGAVNGVTIKGNVLENAMGDSIGTDASAADGGTASNVLIDSNTLKNPRRCGIALVKNQNAWVITNNVIDKQVNYVSGIDFEPEGGTITNVEVAYNKFVMNNRKPGKHGSDGRAASAWQNQWSPAPGGNLYLHHNWGTFGVGWWMTSSSHKGGLGDWYNVVQTANVEGDNVPN